MGLGGKNEKSFPVRQMYIIYIFFSRAGCDNIIRVNGKTNVVEL
jgi:hypothetical protein